MFTAVATFFKDSWSELRQVSWLTVPQMVMSTWFVIILSLIMALYVLVVDKGWQLFLGMVMP